MSTTRSTRSASNTYRRDEAGTGFLVEQGLSSNHARAVLWWAKHGAALVDGGGELIDRQYAGKESLRRQRS